MTYAYSTQAQCSASTSPFSLVLSQEHSDTGSGEDKKFIVVQHDAKGSGQVKSTG